MSWYASTDGSYPRCENATGIVVSAAFPDADKIRSVIEKGIAARPDDVWILQVEGKANHAISIAWAVLREHGIEPLLAPLMPMYKLKGVYDYRQQIRDWEMRTSCGRIVVFHDGRSETTKPWTKFVNVAPAEGEDYCKAKINVVLGSKAKVKKRRATKSVS